MRTSCSDNAAQNNCDFALLKLPLPEDKQSALVKGQDWNPGPGFLTVGLGLVFFFVFLFILLL